MILYYKCIALCVYYTHMLETCKTKKLVANWRPNMMAGEGNMDLILISSLF